MLRNFIREHRIFFGIISVAIIVHISVFFILKTLAIKHPGSLHHSFPVAGGGFDAIQYPTLADNIIRYGDFSMRYEKDEYPETFRTPGYPFFVAVIKYITGTINAVPFFQIILLALSALLFYLTIISAFPNHRTIALVASALFVFDPALFFSSELITTECLYIFFFLLGIYLLVQRIYSERITYALSGISLGISAFVRPSGLYMIIPIAVWMMWCLWGNKNKRKILQCAGILLLAMFLTVLPWYIRNGVRTGVYAFSSLDAYNIANFNIPLYLSYKNGYQVSVEDIRKDINQKIGNLSDEEQLDLKNSPMIKDVVWKVLKPDLFGYAVFHISKTVNFFVSPSLKLSVNSLRGFWNGQPNGLWRPETSFVNSLMDGRFNDTFKSIYQNTLYFPESLFLLIMFICGIYWYWKTIRRSDTAKLIFLLIFFLALLTSPISNPRYRVPVIPFIYFTGLAGASLLLKKFREKSPNSP